MSDSGSYRGLYRSGWTLVVSVTSMRFQFFPAGFLSLSVPLSGAAGCCPPFEVGSERLSKLCDDVKSPQAGETEVDLKYKSRRRKMVAAAGNPASFVSRSWNSNSC